MALESLIIIGGIYHIILTVFHLLFWKIFDWARELKSLGLVNRNIMQILNLCLTFVFIIFAYISLFHSFELLTTNVGKSVLILISVFWLLRAIEQIIFFGLKNKVSIAFFAAFLFGTVIYFYPFYNQL